MGSISIRTLPVATASVRRIVLSGQPYADGAFGMVLTEIRRALEILDRIEQDAASIATASRESASRNSDSDRSQFLDCRFEAASMRFACPAGQFVPR